MFCYRAGHQFYEHLIEQGLAYDNPTLKCKVSNRYKKTYIDSKGEHKNNENYKAIPIAEGQDLFVHLMMVQILLNHFHLL